MEFHLLRFTRFKWKFIVKKSNYFDGKNDDYFSPVAPLIEIQRLVGGYMGSSVVIDCTIEAFPKVKHNRYQRLVSYFRR